MSNKQKEDIGNSYKKSSYRSLGQTWVYSCPKKDTTYPGINSGVNCLCLNNDERSVMDNYYINKTGNFPVSNQK